MLVLTRRIGDVVYIGDDIKIIVLKVGDGKVSIGFDAPREIDISRRSPLEKSKYLTEKMRDSIKKGIAQ